MKTQAAAFLFLSAWLAAGLESRGQELPMFGQLPELAKSWIMHERGTDRRGPIAMSWLIFTNSNSGDVLSFYEHRIGNKPVLKPINQGPWAEMGISLFPGGYPAWNKPPGLRIKEASWARNGLVDLNKGEVAVESTTVWEEESGANRLAHGFALALGELRLYVQHTSTKIITPELAQSLAYGLIDLNSKRKAAGDTEGNVDCHRVAKI